MEAAKKGPFDHVVLEQGDVESSSNNEVKCMVEARGGTGTPILWVIDEGSYVKKGDKLCELDSSALENEMKAQRIVVSASEALVISSDAALKQAEIAKQEYLEGTYETERRLILSEINVASKKSEKWSFLLPVQNDWLRRAPCDHFRSKLNNSPFRMQRTILMLPKQARSLRQLN